MMYMYVFKGRGLEGIEVRFVLCVFDEQVLCVMISLIQNRRRINADV